MAQLLLDATGIRCPKNGGHYCWILRQRVEADKSPSALENAS
jgi:hypothetical protein